MWFRMDAEWSGQGGTGTISTPPTPESGFVLRKGAACRSGRTIDMPARIEAFPRRALFLAFVVLCVFSLSRGAWAQYRSTQWTADSGLPQNSVRGIVQAADGYLWVATLDGIAKFDGIRFTVFNKSNTPGITSNRFVAMAAGDGGDLWMASEDDNLIRYHAGHFESDRREGRTAPIFGLVRSPTIVAAASGWTPTTRSTVGRRRPGDSKGKHSTATKRDSFLCGGAEPDSGRFRTAISCVSRAVT